MRLKFLSKRTTDTVQRDAIICKSNNP